MTRTPRDGFLLDIANVLTGEHDLTESLRRVCRQLAQGTGAETVSAYLLETSGRALVPAAAYRVPKEMLDTLARAPLPLEAQGFSERVFTEGEVTWSDDVPGDDRFAFHLFRRFPHQSGAIIPLMLGTRVAGAFYLVWWKERRTFDASEAATLLVIGQLVALLLRNAMLMRASTAAEESHRRLFENVPVGLLRTRVDGAILDANPAFIASLGYPDLAALQAAGMAALYWDLADRERFRETIRRDGVVRNFDVAFRRRDGTQIWVRLNTRVIQHGDETQYEGVLQDVSDLKRAEDAERQSEALRSVMRLANAAAHEINNPLAVVLGRLQLLRRDASDPATAQSLDQAMAAGRRVAEIVSYMGRIARLEDRSDLAAAGSPMLDIRKSAETTPEG
ncbi:MAG TPA: PAS domain S-box protein [Methylomirabilota bacterium]|nr:PAS domain S-box protein [Methylomirabilota bacterium]